MYRSDLVKSLIKCNKCICGTTLNNDLDKINKLNDWKNQIEYNQITEKETLSLHIQLQALIESYEVLYNNSKILRQELFSCDEELEDIKGHINKITEAIGTDNVPAKVNEDERRNLEIKITILNEKTNNLKETISKLNEDKDDLTTQLSKIEREQNVKNVLIQRANLSKITQNELKNILNNFTKDKRHFIIPCNYLFKEIIE